MNWKHVANKAGCVLHPHSQCDERQVKYLAWLKETHGPTCSSEERPVCFQQISPSSLHRWRQKNSKWASVWKEKLFPSSSLACLQVLRETEWWVAPLVQIVPSPWLALFPSVSDVSHSAISPVVLQVHRGGWWVVTSGVRRAKLWHSSLTISLTRTPSLACDRATHPVPPIISLS